MHVGTSRFRHAMQLQFFRFTPQSAEPKKTPQYGTWLYQSYIQQVYADQNQTTNELLTTQKSQRDNC